MSITSFWFLVLIAVGAVVYYIIPKKIRWAELLLLSLIFYYFAGNPVTILFLVADTLIAYSTTMMMESIRKKSDSSKTPFILCILAIIFIVSFWFVVKGSGLWLPFAHLIFGSTPRMDGIGIIAALGMGYFTLQILGYVIDCYWKTITPQKNPFKLFLFTVYFPQLITGPISRYSDLQSLFEGQSFKYDNICMGAQRILWGFCKKLVIAERLNLLIGGITSDFVNYHGFYSWISLLLYPLQMYCDFSGCMDIVLGVSEIFGIKLAENFNNPFFSQTSKEFWQRWHITLGSWAKDYVLFPIQRSAIMSKFGKASRKRFGKNTGNVLKNCVCMFFLWMVMGIWHGGYRYIIGVSFWYWVILMLGTILDPVFNKITSLFEMRTGSFSWKFFRSARTYLIYAVGAAFFSHGLSGGVALLKDCLDVITIKDYANPWIFFDQSVLSLGVSYRDLNILMIGLLMLLVVGILREKYKYARLWIKQQTFVFRWVIWIGLSILVIIYGMYGPEFDARDFIYQGF